MLITLANLKAQRDGLQSQMYAFTARIDALHEEIQALQDRFDLAENQLTLTEGGIQTIEHLLSGGSEPGEDGPGMEGAIVELSPVSPFRSDEPGAENGEARSTPEENQADDKPQTAQERRAKEKAQ